MSCKEVHDIFKIRLQIAVQFIIIDGKLPGLVEIDPDEAQVIKGGIQTADSG